MEIKDFIKMTLTQIVEASKEANTSFGEDAFISSKRLDGSYEIIDPQMIEFDLSVVVTEDKKKDGGLNLKIADFVNIGGGVNNKVENQIINRVKFSIPLILQVSNKTRTKQRPIKTSSLGKYV